MQPELLQCRTALQRFEVALKVVVAAPQRLQPRAVLERLEPAFQQVVGHL